MSTVEVTENKGKDEPRSDNVHYDNPGMKLTVPSVDDTVLDSEGRQLYWAGTRIPMSAHSLAAVQYYRNRDAAHARTTPDPSRLSPATSNAPQASLTPTSGIQDDDC